jgi:hypothetical protein
MKKLPSRAWMLAAVMAIALAVRLVGIDRGLPFGYEEAVPLKTAWRMAGWGERPLDLNPHFFHYPSLTFYTQLGAQALLHVGMHATGTSESTRDFRIRYYTDPAPFYVTGRVVGVLFALLTLVALTALGRATGVPYAGQAAALLLALNVFHIARSQMIEVDVPLTALVTVALWLMVRLAQSPSPARVLLAGAAVGLASATKYTGALLLVPLTVAIAVAPTARWRHAAVAAGACAAAFVLASPFVLIDFSAFRTDLALERFHMQAGHFGGGGQPAALFYLEALGGAMVGWPALVLAVAGAAIGLRGRHRSRVLILVSFVAAYAMAIGSWEMHARRYALPLLPLVYLFAAVAAWALAERLGRQPGRRAAVFVAIILLVSAHGLGQVNHHRRWMETDSRTVALEWIDAHVAPGALVVTEAYGPPLFGPLQFWEVDGDIRAEVYRQRAGGRFRGVLPIPLFQAQPEETAPYYHTGLYDDADVIITTGAVRGRYQADPARFPQQNAFYNTLDSDFELVHTVPAGGDGPRIRVYRNRAHTRPFAARGPGPVPVLDGTGLPPRWRAWFYYRLGLNYEAFGHVTSALAAYERGWPDAIFESETFRQIGYGQIRALRLLNRSAEIPALISSMAAVAPRPADRGYIEDLGAKVSR